MPGYIFDATKKTETFFRVTSPESPELVTVFSSSTFSLLFYFPPADGVNPRMLVSKVANCQGDQTRHTKSFFSGVLNIEPAASR